MNAPNDSEAGFSSSSRRTNQDRPDEEGRPPANAVEGAVTVKRELVVGLGPVPSDLVQEVLGDLAEFVASPSDDQLRMASGAIVRADIDVDSHMLDSMPELKVLARTGVGTERVDVTEADRRGIPVAITPGSNTDAVAEGALSHLLALTKSLRPLTSLVAEGRWSERSDYAVGDLARGTLAVLGYGRIGSKVGALAGAFGMRVVAFDPFVQVEGVEQAATAEEAVSDATHISVHLPSTPETAGLLGATFIAGLRPGAILVNLARGDIADNDALLEGLESGQLAGVGLDVFPDEPPAHHPLFDHPRVVLTPHVMGLSEQSAKKTFQMAAEAVAAVLRGEQPMAVATVPNV